MKTALFLALLAGTLLSTSGEGKLKATRAKLHTLREQVSLLGEILERTERVADMAARQVGSGDDDSGESAEESEEDDGIGGPLAEMLERFFYGFVGMLESMIKGENFQTKVSSLSDLLAGLPRNYSKVTHNSEQQGNTTINTTTTVEKSQGKDGSFSFGHVKTVVDGPNGKSFSSIVQKMFQSASGASGGDSTANENTATDNPASASPTPKAEPSPTPKAEATPTPQAEATPTPKAEDEGAKSVRNLQLLEILELLRNAKTEGDN
ncbi:uncharacterized protein LOC144913833 [Branchiostoma floridae x Branchiostoma belcheri]